MLCGYAVQLQCTCTVSGLARRPLTCPAAPFRAVSRVLLTDQVSNVLFSHRVLRCCCAVFRPYPASFICLMFLAFGSAPELGLLMMNRRCTWAVTDVLQSLHAMSCTSLSACTSRLLFDL